MSTTPRFLFPAARELSLASNVRGLLVERHDLPLVHLRIMLQGGAGHEQVPGSASALSALLEEGAGGRDAIAFASALQQIGAGLAVWSDPDTSNLALQVLDRHFDRALDLLFDLLLRPELGAEGWRRARAELRDRASGRRAEPGPVGTLGLHAVVYGQHPYARPSLPLPGALEALRLDGIRALFRRLHRPERACVVAAGAISARVLERKLAPRIAAWSVTSPARGAAPWREKPRGLRRRLWLGAREGAAQSVLRVGHLGPARSGADFAALKLLNTILGGSFTSRLNTNLRERHGYTYGVRSSLSLPRGPGIFAVKTSVASKDTLAALREIFRELEALRVRPPRDGELEKAKQIVIEGLPATAETLEGLVESYCAIALHELPLDRLARLPDEITEVRASRVHEVAREVIRPERAHVVVVGDPKLAPRLERRFGPAGSLDEDGQPR